jgi:hypothetical protein
MIKLILEAQKGHETNQRLEEQEEQKKVGS